MDMDSRNRNSVQDAEKIVNSILDDYQKGRPIDKKDDFFDQPSKEVIIDIIEKLMKIVYPGYFRDRTYKSYNAGNHLATLIEDVMYRLHKQIVKVEKFNSALAWEEQEKIEDAAYDITVEFLNRIPKIREYLESDLEAALEGDPAAQN